MEPREKKINLPIHMGFLFLKEQRNSIIKKWEDSGLLDGLDGLSEKKNIAQMYESQAAQRLNSMPISAEDTIAYFQNRIDGARKIEHKIRPMQQLITVMMVNIMKKHCS